MNEIIREGLVRAAPKLTRRVALRWGDDLRFWYVCEYHKSGGTWLSQIVSTYLGLPFPQKSLTPLTFPCVVHNHWRYDPRLDRCLYLYRDGRDVMVSAYFARMRRIRSSNGDAPILRAATRHFYERTLGDYDPDDAVANLGRFIELEMRRPRKANWAQHVSDWFDPGRPNVAYLSYEELLRDPRSALIRTLSRFTDRPIDEEWLQASIDRHDFKRVTGRAAGQEDRTAFVRKGVAGDWRNHFTHEAAQIFDRYAGDALIRLGYEPDRSWVDAVGAHGEPRAADATVAATPSPAPPAESA